MRSVFPEQKILQTSIGKVHYDYLVFAAGTTTNFFGNKNVAENAIPMKNVSEAMGLRNALLENFERALTCSSETERQELLNVVIVGGGATGVEVAGALSEMKNYVLPKDYPDMSASLMNIYLIEAGPRLLGAMSEETSEQVKKFLQRMGVNVLLNKMVTDYTDHRVQLKDGTQIPTRTFIWVSGVAAESVGNLPEAHIGRGGRIIVDKYNRVEGLDGVYAHRRPVHHARRRPQMVGRVTRSWRKWPFSKDNSSRATSKLPSKVNRSKVPLQEPRHNGHRWAQPRRWPSSAR